MKAGKRLGPWLLCAGLVAAIPIIGSTNAAARTRAPASSPASAPAPSARLSPFLPSTRRQRAIPGIGHFRVGGAVNANLAGRAGGAGSPVDASGAQSSSISSRSGTPASPLITPTAPDDLTVPDLAGTAQAGTIHSFGADQEVTPPNEDIAAGPTDLVEVVNSTMDVFSRAGALLGRADLNSFMHVRSGYHSSDPRVIYDAGSARFFVTITEVPNVFSSPSDCPAMAPVEIAVSGVVEPAALHNLVRLRVASRDLRRLDWSAVVGVRRSTWTRRGHQHDHSHLQRLHLRSPVERE